MPPSLNKNQDNSDKPWAGLGSDLPSSSTIIRMAGMLTSRKFVAVSPATKGSALCLEEPSSNPSATSPPPPYEQVAFVNSVKPLSVSNSIPSLPSPKLRETKPINSIKEQHSADASCETLPESLLSANSLEGISSLLAEAEKDGTNLMDDKLLDEIRALPADTSAEWDPVGVPPFHEEFARVKKKRAEEKKRKEAQEQKKTRQWDKWVEGRFGARREDLEAIRTHAHMQDELVATFRQHFPEGSDHEFMEFLREFHQTFLQLRSQRHREKQDDYVQWILAYGNDEDKEIVQFFQPVIEDLYFSFNEIDPYGGDKHKFLLFLKKAFQDPTRRKEANCAWQAEWEAQKKARQSNQMPCHSSNSVRGQRNPFR